MRSVTPILFHGRMIGTGFFYSPDYRTVFLISSRHVFTYTQNRAPPAVGRWACLIRGIRPDDVVVCTFDATHNIVVAHPSEDLVAVQLPNCSPSERTALGTAKQTTMSIVTKDFIVDFKSRCILFYLSCSSSCLT